MFKKVLFPFDGALQSTPVLQFLNNIPVAEGAEIRLLAVNTGETTADTLEKHLQNELRIITERGYASFGVVLEGDPLDCILNYAAKHEVDALCMLTHTRHGISRLWNPSLTESIIQQSHCPVIALNEATTKELKLRIETTFSNILVPIDNREGSSEILDIAEGLLNSGGGRITLFHDVLGDDETDDNGESVELRQIINSQGPRLQSRGIKVELASSSFNKPVKAILEQAEVMKANAILMGTHGGTGLNVGFMGSTSVKVIRGASCPVIVLRFGNTTPEVHDNPA
jgi:nucleotide-binding universal stress UspA family protein